jgi:trigger factor
VKLEVVRLPESLVRLDIVASDEELNASKERAFKAVSKQIRIPGFRPGKAPRQRIEALYGADFYMEEAHRDVIDKLYRQAIDEASVVPVGQPGVSITAVEPLTFEITVPVFPTIDPGAYTEVRVDTRDAALEDSEVDEAIERLQKANGEWVEPETPRAPGEGDQVVIDLKVAENGEEFDRPIADAVFVLGESNLFADLRTLIESMQPGETKTTDIAFAEDDENVNAKVRGKTLQYEVTLKSVKSRELPEIDDAFAKKTADQDSVAAMRELIARDLHRNKTTEQRNAVFNEIIEKIAEGAQIELPAVMIDDAVQEEIKTTEQRLMQQGMPLDMYLRSQGVSREQFEADLRPGVARRLRNSLLLREIAEKEGIAVADEDVDIEIDAITAGTPNAEQLRELYSKEGYFRRILRDDLFDRKLTDRIVEIATEGRGAVTNAFVEPEPTEETAAPAEAEAAAEGDEA